MFHQPSVVQPSASLVAERDADPARGVVCRGGSPRRRGCSRDRTGATTSTGAKPGKQAEGEAGRFGDHCRGSYIRSLTIWR